MINNIKKMIFCLVMMAGFYATSFAQGHNLRFMIEGLSDTTVYLGYYFGESTYLKDTAEVDVTGCFSFKGDEKLNEGYYFIVLDKNRLFDFIVGDNGDFYISTSTDDYYPNMKVEGDLQNKIYLQNMLFNADRNEEAMPFITTLRDSASSDSEKTQARSELAKINEKVMKYQQEIINKYPSLLISRVFKSHRKPDVPEAPAGTDKREFGYRYLKNNYWNNFDLGDPALLRVYSPIYKEKLELYFDKMVVPDADSVMKEINKLAQSAKATEDTYKYFIWMLTLKYQKPRLMGLDEVFVGLVDTYFESGEMDFWVNDQMKLNLKESADRIRLSLVGNTAPNMIMMDKDNKMRSMYAIPNQFTVVYFFDPDCGHCKKETPILKNFYDETKHDVEVFAVSADTSMAKMKNYIQENKLEWITVNGPRTSTGSYHKSYDATSTPMIYVINEDKKIIGKELRSAGLEKFLDSYKSFVSKNADGG